jgi:hypothetical protein
MWVNKETIDLIIRDRTMVILLLAGTVLASIIIISSLLQVRPSDVQVPVRYSAYANISFADRPAVLSSGPQLGRDKWYYLLSFAVFGLLLLIAHPILMIKLLKQRGRYFAVGLGLTTILIGLIGILITQAVLRVAS